jgi:cystathionine beta-lyase
MIASSSFSAADNSPAWNIDKSRARGCKRWNQFDDGVIDLTVAEMDTPVAGPVRRAVVAAVERQAFGYPLADELSSVPGVTAEWLADQYGLVVNSDRVRLVPELMRGIIGALTHLTRPGSSVLVPTPTYGRFFDAVTTAGREMVEVPMIVGARGYQLDIEAIERGLRAGAGSVLLCHPGNPTGRVFTAHELRELAGIVDDYGARVISDEIHAPLRYNCEFTPYVSVSEEAKEHGITMVSATKAWNFPGLRCGMMVFTNENDAAIWSTLPRAAVGGMSPLGMVATVAAFREGQPWLDAVKRDLVVRRDLVGHILNDAGTHIVDLPDATYLAWLDLRNFGVDDPSRLLREQIGVATSAGPDHGWAGRGFVRLNFATPTPVLEDALERIAKFLMDG